MANLLRKLFARGKGHYDAVASVKDDFEWYHNPATPYHMEMNGPVSSCHGRRTTSCPGGTKAYSGNFEAPSAKTLCSAPDYNDEPYFNSESSVYGSAEASAAGAVPSICCAENNTNERIAVLEAQLQTCRIRLRLEVEKKRRYKEKLLAEREMREASESIHLREIMRLKRERQNLLMNRYVAEQKYYRF
uniref:BZIP domain-containing protein n=1 Tax=Ascaris lumbricoides TaxID=6252 RepID=A0A0M3HPI9_ASCLU